MLIISDFFIYFKWDLLMRELQTAKNRFSNDNFNYFLMKIEAEIFLINFNVLRALYLIIIKLNIYWYYLLFLLFFSWIFPGYIYSDRFLCRLRSAPCCYLFDYGNGIQRKLLSRHESERNRFESKLCGHNNCNFEWCRCCIRHSCANIYRLYDAWCKAAHNQI